MLENAFRAGFIFHILIYYSNLLLDLEDARHGLLILLFHRYISLGLYVFKFINLFSISTFLDFVLFSELYFDTFREMFFYLSFFLHTLHFLIK